VLFAVIIFGLIRRSNDPLVKVLTVIFTGVMMAKELMLSLAYGDQYQIAGETFRLQLNFSILGPVLSLIIFGMVLFWIYRNKLIRIPEATNLNVTIMIGFLTIPCFLFLRLGIQHEWTDVVGINLIYLQFTLLVLNWMGIFKQVNKT